MSSKRSERSFHLKDTMDGEIKSNSAKSSMNRFPKKDSLVISVISLVLFALIFVRIEVVRRRAEVTEAKLEKRIQRIEDEMQEKVLTIVKGLFKTERNPTTRDSIVGNYASVAISQETVERAVDQDRRERRNVAPTPGVISLQQIRQEIDRKITQACATTDKICQTGQQGPQGVPGAPGYPGYKGEKGAPGKTGPLGPKGLTGAQGVRGKLGPTGPQGVNGEKGEIGAIGSPGEKGDTGPMGPTGFKGSTGLKGNKGNRGSTGIPGPKGECVAPPRIVVFPESQYVFSNKSATFYCWVQGHVSKKITWRKLGGNLHRGITAENGVLYITNAQRPHTGSYLCTVFTSYGIFRAVTILGIKAPPVLIRRPPPYVYADKGTTVNLCCKADGSLVWSSSPTAVTSIPSSQQNGCLSLSNMTRESAGKYTCRATNQFGFAEATTEVFFTGCKEPGQFVQRFCHSGWMLIARFSNKDSRHWMNDKGDWWYDRLTAFGATIDPSVNADMISPGFWLAKGTEFKITRSDDPYHTPLLETTGNCLRGQTFRSKITSYGNFRNGRVWSSDRCLGSCRVQYGGEYKKTQGFELAECGIGDIQSRNKIGFWCHYSTDGSVMMIGGKRI